MNYRPAHVPEILIETDTVKAVRDAVHLAVEMRTTVHIVGRPGTGKTSALWHIAQEFKGTYCEVSAVNKNTKGMLEMLLMAKGVWNGEKYTFDLASNVHSYFCKRERWGDGDWEYFHELVIVDEVQTLEATALRELLRLHERCEFALVIAGNEERMAGTRQQTDTMAQNERRIMFRRPLPGPSRRDCELMGASFNVEGKDAYEFVVEYGMATNLGDLNHLLTVAKKMTGGIVGIRLNHLMDTHRILGKNQKFNKRLGNRASGS